MWCSGRAAEGSLAAPLLLGWACLGCGGGSPLLHPAHVLRPGTVSVGAGLSGQMVLAGAPADDTPEGSGRRKLAELTVAPAMAPWVSARTGLEGANEAGLTYTGRSVRLDGRHAFFLGAPTLSVGLGVNALLAETPDAEGTGAYGAGVDVPVLLGFQSTGDLYSLWFGPRAGFELLQGRVLLPTGAAPVSAPADASGYHLQLGFVVGARVGFRHAHVALEVGAAYHRASGELDGAPIAIEQVTVAPGGALAVTF
jgi:hypothetical protein